MTIIEKSMTAIEEPIIEKPMANRDKPMSNLEKPISNMEKPISNMEKKENWINYLAFTTVIFAALATLSTFKGGGFSSKSVVFQAQASDQWAYYQAKSTRESLYNLQRENLSLQLDLLPTSAPAEERNKIQQAIIEAENKIQKYETEKNTIEKAARNLEQNRDQAQQHSKPLGLAVIFLQIAIVLSSIGGLLKRKHVWLLGLPIGLAGIILFADGFLLFLPLH